MLLQLARLLVLYTCYIPQHILPGFSLEIFYSGFRMF